MTSDSRPTVFPSPPLKAVPAASGGIEQEAGMAYFKIVRASGGYRAQFWSGGNLVWWTEVYRYRAGAQNAIDTIRRHGGSAQQKAA
jgi:uncharacterized protein YegP (UPF0339 family)